MATATQIRRRGRWSLFAGTLASLAVLLTTVVGGAFGAGGATISSATLTGGTGTVGTSPIYAKQGGHLTLAVSGTSIACVVLSGGATGTDTAAPFSFALTAGAGDGTVNVTATAFEKINNNGVCGGSSDSRALSYVLDNTAPTLLPSNTNKSGVSPAPNAAGWNNSNVGITWSATDSGSGIGSAPTPATDAQTVDTPASGVTKSSTASDRLGTSGTGSVTIKLDKTSPTISAVPTPGPNANGWNNSDVSLLVTCADALSGIKSCSGGGTVLLSNQGANQSVTASATDVADNSVSQSVGGVNIDRSAPTLAGAPTTAPNGNGWYNADVAIHWSCSDALSGIAGPCPADSTIGGEGSGVFDTKSISDRAGNSTTASSQQVSIDRHAPVTNATAPPAWNNTDVSVDLDGGDGLSGIDATYYKVNGGAEQIYSPIAKPTFAAEGTYTLEYWSVDKAGNEEAHHSIQVGIDKTPPTIGHNLEPAANGNGWSNSDTTVHFICADALAGIASCSADQVVASEGANQTVIGKAVDDAGNEADDPAQVSLDKTAPTIAAAADRAANGDGWYDGDVVVSFTCADTLSGVDTCPAPVTVGEGANQSAGGTVHDNAGNSASVTLAPIDVDKTAPALTGAATEAPTGNDGWYTADVTVHWACSDALSGIAGACPADDVIAGEGDDLGAAASVSDLAGNTKNALVGGIKIDRHAPNTGASLSAPVAAGWYGPAGAEVTLNGHDPLSGVASTSYRVDGGAPQTYTGPFTFDVNGIHTIAFWSIDAAGNVEDATSGANELTVKVDKVDPTIHAVVPPPNANGWYMTPVLVGFSCDDDESGIDTCSAPVTVDEGAGRSADGHAKDIVGNGASTAVNGINVDLTPPSLSGAATTDPNGNGWYKGDVTVHWTCSDALSGIDGACPADSTVDGEGSDLAAGPVSVSDDAGNSSTASVSGIKIDRTDPTIAASRVPAANANGWNDDDVAVSFACADALSGIAACPAAQTFGEGDNQSATGTAIDRAGNTAADGVTGIKVDKTKPTIVASATKADGSPYEPGSWSSQSVTVHFTCSDALSGLAGDCPADATVGASTGISGQIVSGSISDRAGNGNDAQLLVKVDKGVPAVAITAPPTGSSVVGGNVTVTGTASDALSGLASVAINGAPASLGAGGFSVTVSLSCGANTITAFATDNVGNTDSAQIIVTRVCYTATYFQPLDMSSANGTVQNTVKYGRVVPVKVQVLNVDGVSQTNTQINAPTVSVTKMSTCTSTAIEAVEESYDPAGSSNGGNVFRWDPLGGVWIYNLDTKAMNLSTASCYRIDVKLDGNVISTSKWAVLKSLK